MDRGFFITGTDTGVGKTLATVALLHVFANAGKRVVGMKPVATGSTKTPHGLRNSDALQIQQASTVAVRYEEVNPYAFEPPIAPHIAAAHAGVHIDIDALSNAYRQLAGKADIILVEGAGGWRTPLNESGFLSDLPETLRLDVILTVGLRLGCLNHARLTAEAIIHGGRSRLVGWIGNVIDRDYAPLDENIVTLQGLIEAPCLGIIPALTSPSAITAARHLSIAELTVDTA